METPGKRDLLGLETVETDVFCGCSPDKGRGACATTHFPDHSRLSACLPRGDLEPGNCGKRLILGSLSVLEIVENIFFTDFPRFIIAVSKAHGSMKGLAKACVSEVSGLPSTWHS